MPAIVLDPLEEQVPQLAVQALNAAQRRAINSGRSVIVVVDGELVRIGPSGKIVLKKIAPRKKVTVRFKERRRE